MIAHKKSETKKKRKPMVDEDCDSDDPMYEECYGGAFGSDRQLEFSESDMHLFIQVLIFDSRDWDNEYYNSCNKNITHAFKCPCSKLMKSWRTINLLKTYEEDNSHASFWCKFKYKNDVAFESHVRSMTERGCFFHYAIQEIMCGF